jgi:glycosyltransferase involved in cell wall biosynthesis
MSSAGADGSRSSSTPFVSVLVPVWNAEATIEAALASVLEARGARLQCVVVDDGSTDGTVERVRAVARGDDRVELVELGRNEGVSAARNRGLEVVRGDWLTLLDADDRFTPGGLDRLVGATRDPAVRAVIGQQVWFDGGHTWVGRQYDIPDIRTAGRTSLGARPGLVYFASPHAKLLHRSCFDGLRFTGRVLGDQPWVLRSLLRAGEGIEVLDETVYAWHRPRHASATTGSSITSRTRASADRGVEAAAMALRALADVRSEATLQLPEPARAVLMRRYVERLLRYDLAIHLAGALERADPTIDQLEDAIGRFVAAVPPDEVAASDALARDVLQAVLLRWHRVDRAGRRAYWRLFSTALAADPAVIRRMASPVARAVVRIGRPAEGAAAGWVGR